MKTAVVSILTACVLFIVPAVHADWDTTNSAKWVQLPDETPEGIDVKLYDSQMPPSIWLADDFLCKETGPITDVHIWGSWNGDLVPDPALVGFNITIWSDVPTNQPGSYSHPGLKLWETNMVFPDYVVRHWTNVDPGEGWYDPFEEVYTPFADTGIWQYNFFFDPTNTFIQQGTEQEPVVYWLGISATISDGAFSFGWKTSATNWNDDAVWAEDDTGAPVWEELIYPQDHPKEGLSMDLSFVITTTNAPEEPVFDFGDAPTNYPTLLIDTGAYHAIVAGAPWFGDPVGSGGDIDKPDSEPDGQPNMNASGDDLAGLSPDDEDGILFSPPIPGQAMQITMKTPIGGQVDAWLDLNADGDWADANEQIYSGIVSPGVTSIYPVIPFGVFGSTYARFRIGSAGLGPIPVDGLWPDGEVEDHLLVIPENAYDFGDAPIPGFPTILSLTGAYHVIVPGVMLGTYIDGELDGQPNGTSTGDDIAPTWLPDDEDGIILPNRLIPGASQIFVASATVAGSLTFWIDYNANGIWDIPGEEAGPFPVGPGSTVLPLFVPPTAVPGGVHCRFRYAVSVPVPSTQPWGAWGDGEVEDYEVEISHADFGDAPDAPYPTTLGSGGAWHAVNTNNPKIYLGSFVDVEVDGQPNNSADGDDTAGIPDDEDGVTISSPLVRGSTGIVAVVCSTNGYLFGWVDLDKNGSWGDAADKFASSYAVTSGVNFVEVPVPVSSLLGVTYARFRISSSTTVGYSGFAPDGEVEDYVMEVLQPDPTGDIVITNMMMSGGSTGIVWWAWESNVTYQMQASTNLLDPADQDWTDIGGTVDAPVHKQSDDNAVETVKFYRVTAPWTP